MMTSSITSRDPEVKVVTPIYLSAIISKTARDRDSVTMGHISEMAYVVPNDHVTNDVTDPERLTS